MLHSLIDFLPNGTPTEDEITYWYQGRDPKTGEVLQLPRTTLAEAIALGLMQELAKLPQTAEGKMYGILLVATPTQEKKVLKAFSGLLEGAREVTGWVPSIAGRTTVSREEEETLALLDLIKQELISLEYPQEREDYQRLSRDWQKQLEKLTNLHSQRKHSRDQERQKLLTLLSGENLTIALERLNQASQKDGIERKNVKKQGEQALITLKELIDAADRRIGQLRQERKVLSRQLQQQLYQAYSLRNFNGESTPLSDLMKGGQLPTGTGECCAPKLLHYAATHHLTPLTMAEFWWGMETDNRFRGQFYGACSQRCQPIMGFLLSGSSKIQIIYQDQWLLVVNKPSGLLSVPGRYLESQDSVETRFLAGGLGYCKAVHRLDQDTSGLLVLALDALTYRQMLQRFAQKEVTKVYEAILDGLLNRMEGIINLPLWSDPCDRPYQKVDPEKGKPSTTRFQVIAVEGNYTRVKFFPLTGRTHQLRVHAEHQMGIGTPILGDRLYGRPSPAIRLHLHATKLSFAHPIKLGEYLTLEATTPF